MEGFFLFFSPYFARWAQYGLFIALLPLAIRAFYRPISPVGLNTGSWRLLPVGQYAAFPGLRYAYPGLCSSALSGREHISPQIKMASMLPINRYTFGQIHVREILRNERLILMSIFFFGERFLAAFDAQSIRQWAR